MFFFGGGDMQFWFPSNEIAMHTHMSISEDISTRSSCHRKVCLPNCTCMSSIGKEEIISDPPVRRTTGWKVCRVFKLCIQDQTAGAWCHFQRWRDHKDSGRTEGKTTESPSTQEHGWQEPAATSGAVQRLRETDRHGKGIGNVWLGLLNLVYMLQTACVMCNFFVRHKTR